MKPKTITAYFTDKEPLIIQRNNEIRDMMVKLERYMKIKESTFFIQ
jgi:hypothetical protein